MPPADWPDAWDAGDFSGAKLAALHGGRLLTYRRDRKPGLPFPGCIDLPGGGREGDESPAACALRELAEEFGLVVPVARVHYLRRYAHSWNTGRPSYFLAVELTAAEVAGVRFGDEGEDWRLLPVAAYLGHDDAIPHLKERLAHYLETGPFAGLAGGRDGGRDA